MDGSGNIYFADLNHNVIREVTASTGIISTVSDCLPAQEHFVEIDGLRRVSTKFDARTTLILFVYWRLGFFSQISVVMVFHSSWCRSKLFGLRCEVKIARRNRPLRRTLREPGIKFVLSRVLGDKQPEFKHSIDVLLDGLLFVFGELLRDLVCSFPCFHMG